MLTGIITILLMTQAPTPPGKTIGPADPVIPMVARTGDGVVLGAIGAADANIIEVATLATTKARDAAVKTLAAEALKAHQKSLTDGSSLAKQFGIKRLLPADSAMARLQVNTMKELNRLSGAAFDQRFVEFVVELHKGIMAKDRGPLLAEEMRPEVKAFLAARQPLLLAHLQAGERWLLR